MDEGLIGIRSREPEVEPPQQEMPDPSDEDLCGAFTQHARDGEDSIGLRCRCGLVRQWPGADPATLPATVRRQVAQPESRTCGSYVSPMARLAELVLKQKTGAAQMMLPLRKGE